MLPESQLPHAILDNASVRGNEYAWQQADVIATIQAAAAELLNQLWFVLSFEAEPGEHAKELG